MTRRLPPQWLRQLPPQWLRQLLQVQHLVRTSRLPPHWLRQLLQGPLLPAVASCGRPTPRPKMWPAMAGPPLVLDRLCSSWAARSAGVGRWDASNAAIRISRGRGSQRLEMPELHHYAFTVRGFSFGPRHRLGRSGSGQTPSHTTVVKMSGCA